MFMILTYPLHIYKLFIIPLYDRYEIIISNNIILDLTSISIVLISNNRCLLYVIRDVTGRQKIDQSEDMTVGEG